MHAHTHMHVNMDFACKVACDIGTCDHHFSMLCRFKLWLDVASLLAAENKSQCSFDYKN